MAKLICTNEECTAHGQEEQRFTVVLTVDERCEVAEDLSKIHEKHFRCCFCHGHTAMKFIPLEEPAND